jgi:Rgg/GadR/MutR family transcriptional activator
MEYELGEVLKKIRQSKRYTQQYISEGRMSRTTYAKIEAGKMQPTVGKFMHILERLDLTYEEFKYIKNAYALDNKDEIIFDLSHISTNMETKNLHQLITKCDAYLEKHSDSIVDDIRSVCKAGLLIQEKMDLSLAYPLAEKVWHRLSQLDNWYSIELKLINGIFFFFPLETGIAIVKRAIREIDRLSSLNKISELKAAYLINLTILLIKNKKYEEAYEYAQEGIAECIAEKRYEIIAIGYARKGIALINMSKISAGAAAIRKALQISATLDQPQLTMSIKEEVRQTTNAGIHL